MHPSIMREMSRQRASELQAEGKRARQVRAVRRARRGLWHDADVDMPLIPDYVDVAVRGTIPEQRQPASAGRPVR